MAIAGGVTAAEWAAAAAAAAAAAGEYYNTQQTAKRQDRQAAQSIMDQGKIQQKADQRVSQTIQQLQGSSAAKARDERQNDYLTTLRQGKAKRDAGLTGLPVGGEAFQSDATNAVQAANNYGATTAGLLSRIDAPTVQRQAEGTSYGNLASDLGTIGQQSQGQAFLDQLRMAAIRRNAKIDLAAGLLSAGSGALAGGGAGAATTGAGAFNGATGQGTYKGPGAIRNPYANPYGGVQF